MNMSNLRDRAFAMPLMQPGYSPVLLPFSPRRGVGGNAQPLSRAL